MTERHRVIFIDLARALAVVLMVAGHTSSALLSKVYRTSPWFGVWDFQRGLTSGLFLLLSGFAFSLATTRHWPVHLYLSPAALTRVGRFTFFILLGYALHFPVPHAAELAMATEQQWRSFLVVDVLQLIGVTLLTLQALVLVTRSRRLFMAAAFALAAALIVCAPAAWSTDWTHRLAPGLAQYVSPSRGSLFPVFPWAAYIFIGAGAGQVYARWGAAHLGRFATWGMLGPGVALVTLGFTAWSGLVGEIAIRVGACLLILGVIAHASRHIAQLPRIFGAIGQESLTIYFVHLCIVYGSIWNTGLYHFYGESLSLVQTLVTAASLVAAMIALGWQWNRLKHARPVLARRISVAAIVILAARLL